MEYGLLQQFVLLFDLLDCLAHLLVQLDFLPLQGIQSIPGGLLLIFRLLRLLEDGLGQLLL